MLQVRENEISLRNSSGGPGQGWKKCKFPGKLVDISRGAQVEDDRPFMTSQKEFIFLKTLHLRASTITAFTT